MHQETCGVFDKASSNTSRLTPALSRKCLKPAPISAFVLEYYLYASFLPQMVVTLQKGKERRISVNASH
jgi:hypothetical protein